MATPRCITTVALFLLGASGAHFGHMGYDVHITRAEHWTESDASPITLDDWLAYLNSDPEMRRTDTARATTLHGETIEIQSPGLAVWIRWSQDGVDGGHAWFMHHVGRITVKNPDQPILRKMYRVATSLKARVQGDEGEFYDADGEPIP